MGVFIQTGGTAQATTLTVDGNGATGPISGTPNTFTLNGGTFTVGTGGITSASRGHARQLSDQSRRRHAQGRRQFLLRAEHERHRRGEDRLQRQHDYPDRPWYGTLEKHSAGTLLLQAANIYTGGTTVTAGTLQLGTTGTLNNSPVTVNGTLQVDALGKSLNGLTLNNASLLAIPAKSGTTTPVTNGLTLTGGARPSRRSSLNGRRPAPRITCSPRAVSPAAARPPPPLWPIRDVTGTTALAGNVLQLTIGTGAANLVWNNGLGTGNWSLNTPADSNFNNGGNDVFMNLDAVTFDDSLTPNGAQAVNLVGSLYRARSRSTRRATPTPLRAPAGSPAPLRW